MVNTVARAGHFDDLIPAQRQGLGSGHVPGVRGDVVHHFAAAGLADLIHSALERSAGGCAGDLVVLSGELVDLELACDGHVLPGDLNGRNDT